MTASFNTIEGILHRLESEIAPGPEDIRCLLAIEDSVQKEKLFAVARNRREHFFGNRIFLYGFIYFSTYCKNDCRFCHYRRTNHEILRYRKTEEEIVEISHRLKDAGIHLIDLTMGEDPQYEEASPDGGDGLIRLVSLVKSTTGLPIMVSPGVVQDWRLAALASAGADWYACYQETHSRRLYDRLRTGQNFFARLQSKTKAKEHGMLIEEGIMTGVGETLEDRVQSIEMMRQLDADQIRVMTFVPQVNTPMSLISYQGREQELVILAVLRLVFPERLIPASLDIDGLDGLKDRLDAGANVITSMVEPSKGLAGVANHSLDIENARRTPDAVTPILHACGLEKATQQQYAEWLVWRKRMAFGDQTDDRLAV